MEKPLHVQVAEALGWRVLGIATPRWSDGVDRYTGHDPTGVFALAVPRYDTDWSATSPLIERLGLVLYCSDRPWADAPGQNVSADGETPLIAVCNLILALKEAGKLHALASSEA
jgi:hypothetical protein